jgi:glucose-6-phosphate 1-dehydrogenase
LVCFGATGDLALLAQENDIEQARIVDPVLYSSTPVFQYEPSTWGPSEVNSEVTPLGGWYNPLVTG